MVTDYPSVQLKDIRHVWYFEPILEHIVFICHVSSGNEPRVSACFCRVQKDMKVW